MITVVHKRDHTKTPDDIYCGRPSPLGNPFPLEEEKHRQDVIEAYELFLIKKIATKDPFIRKALNEIASKDNCNLVCYCKPKTCHCDVIKNLVELNCNYRKKRYAGIGSRATPSPVLLKMVNLARKLDPLGYKLRSGGAKGADTAFEIGSYNSEIFKPNDASREAMNVASKHVKNFWDREDYVKQLHGRNAQILLGRYLDEPVDFVICWTPEGESIGGTGVGIKIANEYNIPVYNLARSDFPFLL